jgi:uncharacterized MAPEG superfamily protein
VIKIISIIRNKKTVFIFYIVNAIVGLVLGVFIYIVFRTDTYISKYLIGVTRLKSLSMYMSEKDNIFTQFARNHMCDFLWAYAFTFSMQIFIKANDKDEYIKLSFYCLLFEILVEVVQKLNIIKGTFDVYDIIFEGLASFIALFIISLVKGENYEKNKN